MEKTYGEFCNVFGINPRNQIIEFLLETRELDYSIGDIAKETDLNRATTYNTISELTNQGYLIKTRVISGTQLYKLDIDKKEVKILIKVFNLVLDNITKEHKLKITA